MRRGVCQLYFLTESKLAPRPDINLETDARIRMGIEERRNRVFEFSFDLGPDFIKGE